ncbi:extracellular solute-binding protein [Cohnella sp. 56]|uniref:extracellular solute-binding protein n=1 Tax=Cohnella sp. 56 TaxID=3113722 RepID=UPI0030E77413
MKKWIIAIVAVLLLGLILWTALGRGQAGGSGAGAAAGSAQEPSKSRPAAQAADTGNQRLEPYQYERLAAWHEQGIPAAAADIVVEGTDIRGQSPDAGVVAGEYEGRKPVALWRAEQGWVEYEVDAPASGLYEMKLTYLPMSKADGGGTGAVQFGVRMNGSYPFREARSVLFPRSFADEWPLALDREGNEIRPQTRETSGWHEKAFEDSEGAYGTPLVWQLERGKNVIRLEKLDEPVAIASLRLVPQTEIPAYAKVSQAYPQSRPAQAGDKASKESKENIVQLEAEQTSSKSDTSIQINDTREPNLTPLSYDSIVYNTVGGLRWYRGEQTLSWEFEAPADGRYQIGFAAYQGFNKNMTVFRTLSIDGKLPFREVASIPFRYSSGWQETTAGGAGGAYDFYLTQGKHTLSLAVNFAPYLPLIVQMDRMSEEIDRLTSELRAAAGGNPDPNRIWDIEKELPGVTATLTELQAQFAQLSRDMVRINGARNEISGALSSAAEDLAGMLRKPNKIPAKQLQIGLLGESVETQKARLTEAPLELDKIFIVPSGTAMPTVKGTFLQKVGSSFKKLVYSFDERGNADVRNDQTLNVWMMWSRDYAQELQRLADEQFTPTSGIKVKINIISDANTLIMANSTGNTPDVALGIPRDTPYDLALRGAAEDLSVLPGGEAFFQKFHPGALLPYYYNGGYYGLPETTNLKVLFYRKDILDELGLKVPNTWDDVYDMLPTLMRENYSFYLDPNDYSPFYFQHGTELYTPDGMKTALDSPQSFAAFAQWTDMFKVYGLEPKVQSFYNQFRSGYMPIGVSDLNTYIQLLVAAPELRSVWAIAPVPGTKQADGKIVRWSGGNALPVSSAMMMKGLPAEKRDHAWAFLQWYMSDDTQTEFGLDLESYFGEQLRWNSGNVAAFARMPWKKDDLAVILDQWQWIKMIPNVPGGYMTSRELTNSWIRAVVDGDDSRPALEKGIREISRELARKQEEFGLADKQAGAGELRPLPQVTEPWTGVKRYVR